MLTWLTFLPCLGALIVAFTPKESLQLQRLVTLATTGLTAILGAVLWFGFDGASADLQYVVKVPWFEVPGAHAPTPVFYQMGVDGISILLVALTAFLMPIVVLSSIGHIQKRVKEFCV